jgi:hypothetical protein
VVGGIGLAVEVRKHDVAEVHAERAEEVDLLEAEGALFRMREHRRPGPAMRGGGGGEEAALSVVEAGVGRDLDHTGAVRGALHHGAVVVMRVDALGDVGDEEFGQGLLIVRPAPVSRWIVLGEMKTGRSDDVHASLPGERGKFDDIAPGIAGHGINHGLPASGAETEQLLHATVDVGEFKVRRHLGREARIDDQMLMRIGHPQRSGRKVPQDGAHERLHDGSVGGNRGRR